MWTFDHVDIMSRLFIKQEDDLERALQLLEALDPQGLFLVVDGSALHEYHRNPILMNRFKNRFYKVRTFPYFSACQHLNMGQMARGGARVIASGGPLFGKAHPRIISATWFAKMHRFPDTQYGEMQLARPGYRMSKCNYHLTEGREIQVTAQIGAPAGRR
jgi:hypothetical protein